MKIGVIGIGEMGGTIARKWSKKGNSVRVANSRGAEAVKKFADKIGADAADIYGGVEGADVVLLSMPFPAVAKLPNDLFNRAAEGLVIIDTGNYYPDVRDARIPEIDAGMPESVWISQQLGRPIFKAFNSIMFYALSELGKPEGSPDRLAIPVAGDDARAKQIVRSEEHTSELQSHSDLVCRLLLEKKKNSDPSRETLGPPSSLCLDRESG